MHICQPLPYVPPQLEQLDERLVPSTASSAISFQVNGDWFNFTEHDWYTIDQTTSQVVEFTSTHRDDLSGPKNVFAVSASLDPKTGYQTSEVFALASLNPEDRYGPLWLRDRNGWHDIGGSYTNISATRDGHVYAVTFLASTVDYLSDSYGSRIVMGVPNSGVEEGCFQHTIAASVGRYGQNEVFAIGKDGAIYVNSDNAPGQWRLVDNHAPYYVSLSATANNTVFVLYYIDAFESAVYQETEDYNFVGKNYYWTRTAISHAGEQCRDISADTDANGRDQVYVIDPYGTAYCYNPTIFGRTAVAYGVYDIAGADGDYYYEVCYSGNYQAYQFNPYYGWIYLDSGLS
jgi:hypothetical protein